MAALAWPLKESKAKRLLSELVQYKTTISLALTSDLSRDIEEIRNDMLHLRTALTESQKREVYNWLHATGFCDQMNGKNGKLVDTVASGSMVSPELAKLFGISHRKSS
ncbi:hypothetical protein B0H63DRAFT_556447 [Podospora didyma]|uniref:Uncharacterized protein n=1 Tax=Podospora didyma TaxID=330526 RepID=A0AAE0NWY0_9PEZI|nr:hypothetical protein B0H63DRAFT_556447 [Podospora didyma]